MFREFHYQVRGRGHVLEGTRGQDRTAYLACRGVQVICLSDGAGSAAHSEIGAQILVDAGCELLSERFGDFVSSDDGVALKLEIVDYLLHRLDDVAKARAVGIGDLAGTFLAVATAGNQFVIVHVGDGVVGYVKDGSARVASNPDNAEFANQTTFLTSRGAAVGMRIIRGHLDSITGFILMSDGTANSLYNSRTGVLAPACSKIVGLLAHAPTRQAKNPKHKKQLRRLVDTKIRFATKDDCAIAVLARKPA
ncbi:PP2C family serine/threonine-protein phosphatase [Mycetocola sp. 2940]|uniref:PP2C family serine/threonine-protein phosphatase n=1 Tax=Mycetocola sp. 2940 TaxID=3156452 RepID=UPI003398C537